MRLRPRPSPGPHWASDPLAGFGKGKREGTMEGAIYREGKETVGEDRKERERVKGRGIKFRGLHHWL